MNGRLRDTWRSLDSRGQIAIIGGVLAVIIVLFVLFRIASKPSYTAIQSGIDPAAASQVAAALDTAGIGYQLVNGGTQVEVVKGQESRARVALAAEGLTPGGDIGWELFDEAKLGATEFQQQVNFQRALEGEIARTIESVDGIRDAQVQLVLPEDQLFTDEGSAASAAVLLDSGSFLDASTVKGVAHLVSSSVKDLDPNNVTITDATGSLLWPTGDLGGGIGSTTKLEAEQRYSSQLTALVNAMLIKTLGPNKAEARVHATLNLDQVETESVDYADEGVALNRNTEAETLTAEGTTPAGAAGTTANIPGFAAAGGGTGNSDYVRRSNQIEFGVDKTVQHTIIAPGTVQRLDVALMFDDPGDGEAAEGAITADQRVDIQNAVAALVGLDAERGDSITTATFEFAPPPKEEPAASPVTSLLANPIGLLKWVVLGIGSLVFLFLMRRSLQRRESEQIAPEPTWLRQIEGTMPIAQLNSGLSPQASIDPIREQRDLNRAEVEEIVKREPDRIAGQVGQWLRE